MHSTTTPPSQTERRIRSRASQRPVLLATLASRVNPSAERMAIDSALETMRPLLVVNAVAMAHAPRALAACGVDALALPDEDDAESVRATAQRAASLGIRTELLRAVSPRPAKTIVELAEERAAALLVLGRPRGLFGWLRFRRAARLIRRETDCLVWIAPKG